MSKRKLSKRELSRMEIRKSMVATAMPVVKRLVAVHGLSIISACIAGLKVYEKNLRELEAKKREVADLERKIK